jgi:hypothetical protein
MLLQSDIDTFDIKFQYMKTNLLDGNNISGISEDYGMMFM